MKYRKKRLGKGITANHLKHELTYLKSAFNTLIKADLWHQSNPLKNVQKIKIDQKELCFLSAKQIKKLLSALENSRNQDTLIIAKICLSTGTRWGEAQSLTAIKIHHGKIHLSQTKTKRNCSIPISKELQTEIKNHFNREGRDHFFTAWEAFNNALDNANIELPRGQKTHVLRHTFASHYMMNGGNILNLNKILGHQSIQMTMVYAHLSPSHLADATQLNPINWSGIK